MKKVLAIMLATVLVFSMAACGEKKDEPQENPGNNEQQIIYDNLAGEFTDSYSGRATMDLTSAEGCVKGLVSWGSSASENDTWEFTLRIASEDTFEYTDCVHARHTWDAQDKESVEVLSENESGYFTLNLKGDLLWNGAADENCRDCVFEK